VSARVAASAARIASLESDRDALAARVAELERKAAAGAEAAQLKALLEDSKALRESVARELAAVDARLADLRRRIDEATSAQDPDRKGPLTPEDEDRWVTATRDVNAGVRYSALYRLGQKRTDRAVQVAVERLTDEDEEVARQAVKNLGAFKERDAAARVAPLLDHAKASVRAAVRDALVQMGAPAESAFDPVPSPEKRDAAQKAAAAKLRAWAESQ
jgi:HEAT repeat protein